MVLIMASCFSTTVKAHNNNMFKRKPWEEYKLKRLLQDSLNRLHSVPPFKNNSTANDKAGVLKLPLKGTFIEENGKGDEIYRMPPDNMSCLVPGKNFVFNMPVSGIDKNLPSSLKKDEEKQAGLDRGKQNK